MGNENGEWILHGVGRNDPRRIHTADELISQIDRIGFLPLFKSSVDGWSVEELTLAGDWWSDDPDRDPWQWRQIIAASGKAAYGKFFGNKAGFISLAWLPFFINARRDGYDFDARWEDEKASYREKKIMDLFSGGEELYSWQIRRLAGFGAGGEKNFEGTLTALQMKTYLVVRDFRRRLNARGEPYGWAIALYTTPEAIWGSDLVTAAYGESPEASGKRICGRIKELFPETTDRILQKIL